MNSSWSFHLINFKLGEGHLNNTEIQTTSILEFSSHGVTLALRQSLITRHQNTRLLCLYNVSCSGHRFRWCRNGERCIRFEAKQKCF